MSTIVTRAGKGSPLTNTEVDSNFTNLNTDKVETLASADGSIVITGTGASRDLSVSQNSPASVLLEQVRNSTGATLTKGTAVYVSGATGQIPTVSKALATGDATSAQTLGLLTSNLANNANGYVTIIGLVSDIDTSAYTDGAQLYLSSTTAGTLTATKPYAPQHLVYVAVVAHAHPTQGKLIVKVQNGYEMDELHNVSAQSPTNGQTLVYNTTTSLWEKNTVSLTAGVNGTLPVANGGTGQTTLQNAMDALAGAVTSGSYLRGNGTHVVMSAIQAADVPTLNQNTTGTAANVTGTVAIANGGTGSTTATAALTALGAYPALNPSGYTSNTGTVTGVTGTAPVVSSGGTAPAISMAAASAGVNGYMTGTYATKLDGIATGATANTGTVTGVTGTAPVVSSGGTAPAISMAAASSGVNGYMTGVYATKLDGIATGATNVTNTNQLTNGAGYVTSAGSVANAATATNLTNFVNQSGSRYTTDVNSLLQTGFYNVEGQPTNSPVNYGQIIVAKGIDTGLQIASGYNNDNLYFRGWGSSGATFFNGWRTVLHNGNYNSYAPTLTGTGASGTWGINVTGTSGSISGFNNPTTAASGNTIVYRDGSGHITGYYGFFNYLNMSHGVSGTTTDTIFYSSGDDYIRKNNATGFRASLNVPTRTGGDASGTWGISITGTAATATVLTNAGSGISASQAGTSYSNVVCVREGPSSSAPRLGFHWAGVVASSIAVESSGRIAITNNPGSGYENLVCSAFTATSDIRSPIFYDSNDTAYYTDPNSYSNLSRLNVNYATANGSTSSVAVNISKGWTGMSTAIYDTVSIQSNDVTSIRVGEQDGTTGGYCQGDGYNTFTSTSPMRFFTGGSATAYIYNGMSGTQGLYINSGVIYSNGFYDNQDSSYYTDPNGGSALKYLRVDGNWGSSPFGSGSETLTVTGTYASICQRATNLGQAYVLHHVDDQWSLYIGRGATNGSDWNWAIRAKPTQDGNYVEFRTSARAPIFYDSDDTGWYSNPNGTSNFNRISTVRTNDWLYIDNNYGHSVVGVYDSYRYQGVFAMGNSYKLPADGTSTGSLYGMAWSHPNAGGAAGNLTDHGLLIINNGVFKCAISNSIVASGNVTAYSDERLKTNWRDMPEDYVTRLAKVKVGIYDRVDQEDVTQVGVSAQSFQQLLPQAIMTAKDEMQTLSVSYGNAALASAVELAKEVVDLRTRVAQLESLITKLIGD